MTAPNLGSIWRRAVVTTTHAVWRLPDCRMALLLKGDGPVMVRHSYDGRALAWSVTAYHVITNGVVGPRIERPAPVETRVWSEIPPNDDTRILVLHLGGAFCDSIGKLWQQPTGTSEAYCLSADLLTAPPPTVVEVTNEDLYEAYKATYTNFSWSHPEGARIANAVNARLRARAQEAR